MIGVLLLDGEYVGVCNAKEVGELGAAPGLELPPPTALELLPEAEPDDTPQAEIRNPLTIINDSRNTRFAIPTYRYFFD
jgi:hypothetical protein